MLVCALCPRQGMKLVDPLGPLGPMVQPPWSQGSLLAPSGAPSLAALLSVARQGLAHQDTGHRLQCWPRFTVWGHGLWLPRALGLPGRPPRVLGEVSPPVSLGRPGPGRHSWVTPASLVAPGHSGDTLIWGQRSPPRELPSRVALPLLPWFLLPVWAVIPGPLISHLWAWSCQCELS